MVVTISLCGGRISADCLDVVADRPARSELRIVFRHTSDDVDRLLYLRVIGGCNAMNSSTSAFIALSLRCFGNFVLRMSSMRF